LQSSCLAELEKIFAGSDREPNLTDLGNMKYLERVIKESLRIRPPVRYVGRKLNKSIKFGTVLYNPPYAQISIIFIFISDGYDEFPAKTVIHVNIFNIHRNPEIYPDPEKFDPDRFLPENCVGRHPYAYIPFSAGPRNCIGQ
jgi:cytochrome P450 family 4